MKLINVVTITATYLLLLNCLTHGLLNLNEPEYLSSVIYKCPVIPDPMHPDRLDQSIIIVNNNTIEDLIKSTTIIVKNDAKIMHQVLFFAEFDDYSFYHASMADIEDIFDRTNTSGIKNQPAKILNQTNLYNEDELNDYEYNQLKNFSSSGNGIHEIQKDDLINNEIYKCIGNPIPFSQYYTVFIVLKLTPTTRKYSVGDTIFSLQSFGYLENITSIDAIETSHGDKIIIHTNLIQCGNYPNSILNNILRRDQFNTNSSELDCSGDSTSKLYIVDYESLEYKLSSVSIGKLIPGRSSSSFGIHILTKQLIGDYVVFEGISLNHLDNALATKLSFNKRFSYTFSKTYGYKAALGGFIKFNLLLKGSRGTSNQKRVT